MDARAAHSLVPARPSTARGRAAHLGLILASPRRLVSRSPLHVCLVTGEYPPAVGGIADYTALLAEHLRAEGTRVSILTSRARGSPHDPVGTDGRVGTNEPDIRTVGGWGLASIGRIASVVGEIQPDLVHLQYQTAAFRMSGAVCLLPYAMRATGRRTRFVTTFHDLRVPYLFPKAGVLRRAPARVLLGASDGCIFTDQADLLAAHPQRKAAWIPIGPGVVPPARSSRAAARDRFHIDAATFVIAYFGFMNASKGVETLLAAAERLIRRGLDFRLLFIGEDQGISDPTNAATTVRLRSLESRLNLEDRFIRTGWLPGAEISRALAAADVAALPYADGASLRRSTLLTCFAHGVPVVTTTPAPIAQAPSHCLIEPFDEPEQYRIDGKVAVLVPAGDDAALARELERLAEDTRRGKAFARSARQFAKRLSWPSIAQGTTAFYSAVLSASV